EAKPIFVPLGPGHTSNVETFFRFIVDCAKDPRFTPDNILFHIKQVTKLDLIDQVLYRFFIIPITKKRLLEREHQFQWVYNKAYPDWGRGRDDAMNLTKYFMIGVEPPDEGTFGPTDFPAIWNLKKYDNKEGEKNPQRLNLAGDTWDAYSVVMDSALGLLGAEPHDKDEFVGHVQWLTDYAKRTPPPKFPEEFALDEAKVAAGKAVFDQHCASCHAEGGDQVGRSLPLATIGTSRDRFDTWGKEYAIKANQVVEDMGLERRGLVEEDLIGYSVPHLDGIWLRAPYLHNGSVPTLRDLLKPAAERPKTFYRGYDLYDPDNVGFVYQGPEAERIGTLHDVTRKGNGNQGHEFGTALPGEEKDALLEYLKTL
ncbi:MAG: c-type cytochrome, partial [Pseudomonadota bacterium]